MKYPESRIRIVFYNCDDIHFRKDGEIIPLYIKAIKCESNRKTSGIFSIDSILTGYVILELSL